MKKFLILFIVFGISLQAQNYVELFQNELPKDIVKNKMYHVNYNFKFQEIWKLNPQLFYYYVTHLNERYENSNRDMENNYYNLLHNKILEESKKSNLIRSKRINYVKESIVGKNKQKRILNLLDDISVKNISNPKETNSLVYDENLASYYFYKKVINDFTLTYSPKKDYQSLLKQIIAERIDFFNNTFTEIDNYELGQLNDLIETSMKFQFLFTDHTKNVTGESINYTLPEYLDKILSIVYKVKGGFFVKLNTTVLPNNIEETLNYQDANTKVKMDIKTNNDIFSILELGIGYRFPLKDSYGMFSFIDVSISHNTVLSHNSDSENLERKAWVYLPNGKIFDGRYEAEYTTSGSYIYSFEASTPIYYLFDFLYFSGGVNFIYNNFGELKINKFQSGVGPDYYSQDESILQPETFDVTDKDFVVSPLITATISFKDQIHLNFEFSVLYRAMIGLDYRF